MLRRTLLILLLIASARTTHGQSLTTPFYSNDGIAAAQARARADLAADAELIFIGSLGDFTIPAGGTIPIDLHLGFYLDSMKGAGLNPSQYPGAADAWIYLFRSADLDSTVPLIVVKILGTYQVQAFQGFPFPLQPGSGTVPVDRPFSGSGAMMVQLKKANSTFQSYHASLPGSRPDFVTYGQLINGDSTQVPIDFLNGPAWTLTFLGGGDTSMTCFVSANTGATFCRQFSFPSSAPPRPTATREETITMFPNPSAGHVRILVAAGGSGAGRIDRLFLVNERGEEIRDLTDQVTSTGVDMGIADLPRGLYFVRAVGPDWQAVAGLSVDR